MKKSSLLLTAIALLSFGIYPAFSQDYALKSNLLYLTAGMTPNISFEAAVGEKWTIDITGSYNPWRLSSEQENKKLQHWLTAIEGRRWLYEKYDGHYFSFSVHYGRYNAGGVDMPLGIWKDLRDHRYQGYGTGVGLGYGYQWYLGPHWNLETSFAFGYSYMNYKKFECARCGSFIDKTHKHYFGPTRIGVSIVYLFKSKKYTR